MNRWISYLQERVSPLFYLPLILGLSFSGLLLNGGALQIFPSVVSFVGLLLFFLLMRLMDDVKDEAKDKIAYPDRPLARGLFTRNTLEMAMNILQVTMFGLAFLIWIFFSSLAAGLYLLITIYLWHMYREFYIGPWLEKRPLIYTLVHEIIFVPAALFPVALASPEQTTSLRALSYSYMICGAFLIFDICRKLDPKAHPILLTHVQFYGYRKMFYVIVAGLVFCALGARTLGLEYLLWPVEVAVFLAALLLFFDSGRFRFTAATATLSLVIHAWAVVFKNLGFGW